MYCISFRRPSLRVDRNRRNRRSDSVKNNKQQLPIKRCGNETSNQSRYKSATNEQNNAGKTLYRSNKSASRDSHQNNEKRRYRSMSHERDERLIIRSTVNKATNPKIYPIRGSYLDTRRRITNFEKEQRQQENEDFSEFNLTSIPLSRSPNLMARKAAHLKKDFKSNQFDYMQQFPASERFEEKKDDVSDLLSRNHVTWTNQSTSSGKYEERAISSNPAVQKNKRENLSQLKENSLMLQSNLDQRSAHKSFGADSINSDKYLTKPNEFKNLTFDLKANGRSQPTEYDTQHMKKIVEAAKYYRTEFEVGEKKRQLLEDELEKTRDENQKYAEQIDVLIFEYIPKCVPKFKEIGPVDYNIKESLNFVDSYQLGEILGEGHYGSVRSGTHTKSQQRFAVKILNKSNVKKFKDIKQIAIEIHVLKTYLHPNIIYLQEVVHAADNIYMITELCTMDLHKYLNEIGLTIDSARQVIYGILKPLYHLHLHGICHLDLKPENVLLTKLFDSHNATHQHVRICDFGLVDITRNSGANKDVIREGYVCGTPGFYAPEMILQDKFEGRSADMWSLGCIILEITLGFTQEWIDSYDEADENPTVFHKGLQSCLSEISIQQYPNYNDLLDLIHSCLSINPSNRTTSDRVLAHTWFKQIEDVTPRNAYSCRRFSSSC